MSSSEQRPIDGCGPKPYPEVLVQTKEQDSICDESKEQDSIYDMMPEPSCEIESSSSGADNDRSLTDVTALAAEIQAQKQNLVQQAVTQQAECKAVNAMQEEKLNAVSNNLQRLEENVKLMSVLVEPRIA